MVQIINVKTQRKGKSVKTWVAKTMFLKKRTFELGLEEWSMIIAIYFFIILFF